MMYCPFCFAGLQPAIMICKNPGCTMHEQSMPVKKPRLRTRLPDDLRQRYPGLLSDRRTDCDACGLPCVTICDACGRQIPSAWTRYPEKSILMMGVRRAGKSTLLATGVKKLSEQGEFIMTPLEAEETGERFYEEYIGPMTRSQADVVHTPDEYPRPFLWGLSRRGKTLAGATALAVYDIAGELQGSHAKLAPLETMIGRASGVCLVINPASLPQLQKNLPVPGETLPDPDVWERAERLLDEIQSGGGVGTKSKVRVAVVFTHLDIWFSLVKECSSTDALSSEWLYRLAKEWRGTSFLNRLSCFSDYRLFATGLYRGEELRALDGAEKPFAYLLGGKQR